MKSYRPWAPEQSFLLPPSPLDWLPKGHLAYFILDVVSQLDLSAITQVLQAKDPRGERPYSPQMMVGLLLYGYCTGVYSSRRIERATYEDVAMRVLSGGEHPHFTRINMFRKAHLEALSGLFLQVLKLCQKAGLVRLGHVAFDGTKVQANASKHKAMSYARMKKEEERLTREISEMMTRAEAADAEDDARLGDGQPEQDVPAELSFRQARLAKIRDAKAALEEEARLGRAEELSAQASANAAKAQLETDPTERKRAATRAEQRAEQARKLMGGDDEPPSGSGTTSEGLALHRPDADPDGTPKPKAQRNFTDPDSRIMVSGGTYLQGYNAQLGVDEAAQIIVAQAVTNQPPDNEHLLPMLQQVEENCGAMPEKASADAGYWESDRERQLAELGVEAFVPPSREQGAEAPAAVPTPRGDSRARMRAKLATPAGRAVYRRRKAIVEPVFGQMKECRGFRRFHLRGLRSVAGEWSLMSTCHNLLKLFRAPNALEAAFA
jgi:transposase